MDQPSDSSKKKKDKDKDKAEKQSAETPIEGAAGAVEMAGNLIKEKLSEGPQTDDDAEPQWKVPPAHHIAHDPLLGCLVVLTRLQHNPFSPETLIAGLPLVDNKLTPELFIRAAARAGLSAQIV